MLNSKVFFIILTFTAVLFAARRKESPEPYLRYRSIKCAGSPKSVSSFKCYIKAYGRKNTTLNIISNLTRPFYRSYITYDWNYKSLSNSLRSIINATTEVCQFLNGTGNHPVMNWIFGMMPSLKNIIHPCPYEVNF